MSKRGEFNHADSDGQFRRPVSKFRNFIPTPEFPSEKGRYALYINYGCPWAHRANIVRSLKGLEDIIELVEVDDMDTEAGKGWYFSGKFGPDKDPQTGFKYLRELYQRSDPEFSGRPTVPMLWDKSSETVVNNESSEVIRILYTAFDQFLPEAQREAVKGSAGILPPDLIQPIDDMNEWVYDTINNGVYKCGFATTQEAYNTHIGPIFESLDRLEKHLVDPKYPGPFVFGEHITEADIRLYPTLIRFDVGYYMLFKLNLKMIRHDYPNLYKWLRVLYWDESETTKCAFSKTTKFDRVSDRPTDPIGFGNHEEANLGMQYKHGYSKVKGDAIVPAGPLPNIHEL